MDNSPKNKLTGIVRQSWSAHCAGHFSCEVALSGGLDSVVLLHVLCALRAEHGMAVSAVHVHHGLQAAADEWTAFCVQWCARSGVPLRIERVSVDAAGLGVEGAARQARYAVLAASPQPLVALAHHRDDQMETFFLSALRGGGVRGMSAMPALRALNERVCLWRPLLSVSRAELEDYAAVHDLPFVTDSSNADHAYTRNWLRHDVLPRVQARIPDLAAHIAHNIDNLQHTLALLDEVGTEDLAAVCRAEGVLDCVAWLRLSALRRHEVLRRFAHENGLGVPRARSLRDFAQHLSAKPHGHHVWHVPHGTAQAQYGCLWAWPADNAFQNAVWHMDDIRWRDDAYGLPRCDGQKNYTIRTVNAQDTLATRGGRKNVVKLLQEQKVPAFIRRYWPVVVDGDEVCRAVVNVRCDETIAVRCGQLPTIAGFNRFLTELYRRQSVSPQTWQSPIHNKKTREDNG